MNRKRQDENLRKRFNRIVSLICAVVLLLSSVQMSSPVTAFADQNSAVVSETETLDKSVDEAQKTEQGDTNPVSDASSQNEIQTETQSSSQGPVEEQAESALSDVGKQFTEDVAALNWDEIQKTRQAKFEADSALLHHSEDADAKSAAESADSNMKQVADKLTALQKTYQSLSDTDRVDESVQKAEETLESITEKLSTYEKEYFEKQVEALTKAKNDEDTETDKDQASYQADLNSLKAIYKELSDEQKDDSNVKNAYKTLQGFLDDEAAVSGQNTEMSSDSDKAEEKAAAVKKPAAPAKKAPASVSAESITGSLGWKDELTKNVLFDTVNDTDFFQFKVTVTKADGTTEEYTTSLSSQNCHASVDFDYNFTITGISLDDTDRVSVTCVPNSSISGYGFISTASTVKDGKWDAGKLTLSIDEVSVTINDVALGDTGNTLYSNVSCTMDDGRGHKYSRNTAFWGNGASHPLPMPKGASFAMNAERDGYILSTLSSSEITRTDKETNKGSVSARNIENNVSYDFVWVKKATDEESTFTKTWLDDGTDTATHEKTPSLVKLQYKVEGDDGSWKDVSESALQVPSGSIGKTSKANGNKSVYTLSYTGLPEYMAVSTGSGTYPKQKISYRIEESSVPSGYSKESSGSNGQNLVNTKEYTLNATIRWEDSNNAEKARPDANAIRNLIQVFNGETSEQVAVGVNDISVEDKGDGTYTVAVHALPSYNGSMDSPNTYYIPSFSIGDQTASDGKTGIHYDVKISNASGVHDNSKDIWNGATITCTISKKTAFNATKKWDDLFPSLRPNAQLGLYRYIGTNTQNMELVAVQATPNNNETPETDRIQFENLDAYDNNGNKYTYVVKETIPASDNGNYQAFYLDAEGKETEIGCPNGGTLLNKNVKNTTSIYVRKHWIAKGTTLKVAGYTVRVGLKRYTTDSGKAEIVTGNDGKALVQSISGFADYNDLTANTTFKDLPMTDENGNFYTYVPYEVSESSYIATGAEDGTLDQGDAFTIKDSNGEFDTYQVTEVKSVNCAQPTTKTRVAKITNQLGGTIRFVLSKKWAVAPKKTSVQYAIHRVNPYGKEEVLDHDGKTWVALANAKEIYTGELKGAADKRDWGTTDTNIVLPLYDENSSRYTYFVDEVNDKSRHYFDYTLTKDDTGRADLVESVALTNNNGNGGGDGQNMDVDLYKTWVDGGDTSTRRPVVIKVFRKDKAGKIDRPAEWDKENIGVYTLSADNGWHVTNLFGFSEKQLTTYFGSEKNGDRTLTDESGKTRTFDNLLKNDIVYREVKVGDTDVPAGDNCSYEGYTTTLESENGVKVTQQYKVSYAGNNDSEVKNIKQGSVVYEINSKWYDGHYLKGRPAVTFNITRDGNPYATCVVTVDDDGKVSTKVTIDGKDAVEEKDYTFKLGQGESLNDYTLTFDNFPLYNEEAGTRYEYACTESLPSESGYINNSPLDPGFPRTTTGAAGKNKENLKITTSFRNRRVDQSEKISYTKIWKDNSNSENIRPEVTLNLAARVKSARLIKNAGGQEDELDLIPISGDTYMEAVSGKENTYTYTFARSAPKYVTKDLVNASNGALTDDDIGAEVTYYASETMTGEGAKNYKETDTPVNGTDSVKVGDKTYLANGSAFTNTLTATMEASGTKVFSNVPYDMESDPLVMPKNDSIIFKLTQNGKPYLVDGQQATAKLEVKGSSFTFAFKDKNGKTLQLPKYDEEGKPYIYSVTESFPDDAATSFGQVFEMTHVSRDLQVTNKYIAQRRSIQVTKTFDTEGWTQAEKDAGRYPDVEFTLYRVKPGEKFNKANNSQKLKTTTIPGSRFKDGQGKVTISFDNLYDLTPSGQRFAYYVVEKPINGYTTTCSVTSKKDQKWEQTDTAAMQSEDRKEKYDTVSFKNDYQEESFITIGANKTWLPDGILDSLYSNVKNDKLTFHVNGYVNGSGNNVDNVSYTQGTDFTVSWTKSTGDSAFTIADKDGKKSMKFRRYTSQGERYLYRITEDTGTAIWKANGALENFNCANSGHFVQNWASAAPKDNQLNLGTIQNVYGRTSLVVTKQWDDNSNKNDMRPRSITVKLQYSTDGSEWTDVSADFLHRSSYNEDNVRCDTSRGTFSAEDFNVTYTLKDGVKDQNREWTNCLTFRNLPLYANGKQYQYRAVETAIGGTPVKTVNDQQVAASYRYDADSSSNIYNPGSNVTASTLRNDLIPASVSVTKTWAGDSDNKYLARPDSLTLYLQRKVEGGNWEYVRHTSDNSLYTVAISAADNWSYAEQDTLPREDTTGNTYTYRFTEKAEKADGTEKNDSVSGVTVGAKNGNISYTGSEETNKTGTYVTNTVITNTLDTTSLTVEKNWASEDGRTPVTFQIQYQDKTTGSRWIAFQGVTLTLNGANAWKVSLKNLPKRGKDGSDRYYRAVELDKNGNTVNFTDDGTTISSKEGADGARDFDLITGKFRAVYTLTRNDDGTTKEMVTNIKRTTVNVTKTFQDGANREVYRPASLTISCVSGNENVDKYTRTDNRAASASTKAISSTEDKYQYSFIVDQYDSNGKKLNYKIAETFSDKNNQDKYHETDVLSKSADTASTVQLNTDNEKAQEADTAAITNKHDISVFDLTLEKTWTDFDNFYKERPESITVTLQYSTDGTHWNTVKVPTSVEDKDYTKAYAADVTAGYSTDAAEKTLTVNKDGSVNAADATWHNLPVYARVGSRQVALQYRVLESKVTDYNNDGTKATSAVTGTDEKGTVKKSTVSLENTLNTTSVTVTKQWVDDNNFNGQRKDIQVQLTRYGKVFENSQYYQMKDQKDPIILNSENKWTHTFKNLPKQDASGKPYEYSAEEINVPNGYTSSVSKSDSGITITNTLNPVTASISVTKDFGNNDWSVKAPTGFTFTLQAGDYYKLGEKVPSTAVKVPMPDSPTATATQTNPTAIFRDIQYSHIGEYHYTLTENNGGVDGVAYDWDDSNHTQRTHNVVVTVSKNSDNTLAASVKYDGQNSLTVQNTVEPASASIQVTKEFADWSKTTKGFTFTLRPGNNTAGQGADGKDIVTPMPTNAVDGVVSKTATASQHWVDFGSISYEKTGTYTYWVQETAGDEDGITYDTTAYKVEVDVTKATDASNKLSTAVKYYGKDGKELTDGLIVKNTFTSTSGELKVQKDFNDWTKAGSFTFDLTPVENAPMPADAKDGKKSVTVTNGSAAGFGSITFEKAGTYTYDIIEEKGTASGVQYDTQEHTAVVKVEKGAANKLSVTEITYDGKKAGNLTDPLVITNTFTPVQANVSVKKSFNGWTDEAYGDYFANTKFTFNISPVTAGAPLPAENGKNVLTAEASKAAQTATFKPITFVKEGTYTYNIKEENDHKDGISYDGNTHTVTIVVSKDNDNKLTVSSIKYDDTNNSLTITNTYTPAVTTEPIRVTKYISDWSRTEKGFTFTLTAGNNTAGKGEDGKTIATPMPAGAVGTSMTADAVSAEKATAVFGKITYKKAGTYFYTITEENGGEDGITYDAADSDSTKAKEHQVKVVVSKDDTTTANALTAEVTYDGQSSLTITNNVESATVNIQAKKDFNDWNHSASEFTFTLKAGNYCKPGETEPSNKVTVPMPKGAKEGAISRKATSAAPNVDFGAITYKKAGTYHYTITETNDGNDGVSYDTTEHQVTVTVTKGKDRKNALTANVKYDNGKDSLTIQNTFTAATAKIGLTKNFTNPKTKEDWPVDTSFTFDLAAVSNTARVAKNPMPEVRAVTATKDNTNVSFGDITFSKAGTYYYAVTERNNQVDGVSYDAAPHTVAVVVSKEKDSNNNALTANVYYDVTKNGEGTVPKDAKTSLTITNTYTPLKQTVKVTKAFNGWKDWNLFDDDKFTFTLTPVTPGAPMPAGENGDKAAASKKSPEAVFGEITYTKEGTYEYQITETNDHLDGVSYDTTKHDVLVSVTKSKDATNTLSAVVKYDGKDSLTITNTFTPVFQSLSVSKNFNDWTKAHSFTFNLAAKDHAPMPKDLKEATVSVRKDSTIDKTTGYPSATFGQIEFDKAGTYTYTITEQNGGEDGVDYTEDSKDKKPAAHEVKVVIEKDPDTNQLAVKSVDSLTVKNTYTPVTAHAEVRKSFNDWSKADSFTFKIAPDGNTAKDADGNSIANPMPKNKDGREVTEQSVTEKNQTAVFDDMTFEYAGVYNYVISENNDGRDGVSYDSNRHQVTVTVEKTEDATNKLTAKVTYEAADKNDTVPEDKSSLTIQNTFTPAKITANGIHKNFNGWTDSAKYGDFFDKASFDLVLKPVTKDAPMPEIAKSNTSKTDPSKADGLKADDSNADTSIADASKEDTSKADISNDSASGREAIITATKENPSPAFPEMTFDRAGTYEYTLQEVNGGLDGVDYDTDSTGNPKVHQVVVTVTKAEDESNALSASITYDGQPELEIKNTFTPADPPLYVTKNFNDWSKADSFTFQIKAITEGAPMPKNLTAKATEKEKTAAFKNIEFWEVGKGTYEYEITEVNDGIDGIAYDTSVHKAAIKVTKANDATNKLHSEVLFDGVETAENDKTGLMITNTFTAAKVVLKVTKDFNDWSKASGFKFDLKAEGTSPMPEDKTGAVAEATKDHRTAAFGEISFDKAGTYRYTITEENSGISHITYDSTSHTVEVTVIKDEATNALSVASVKYDGEDSLTIKNTYSKPNPNVKPSEKPTPSPKPGPSEKPTPSPKPEPNKDSNRNTNSTSNRTSTTNATPTPAINPVSTTSSKPVQSGDDTQMAGWIIMLIASMSLGFIALEKKKHNNG